jgi:hypothetical protein
MVSILTLLRIEHRAILGMFRLLQSPSLVEAAARAVGFQRLRDELIGHLDTEQDVLYGALLEVPDEGEMVLDSIDDHAEIRAGLARIATVAVEDPGWLLALSELSELVEQHFFEEEESLFALARAKLGDSHSAALADRYCAARQARATVDDDDDDAFAYEREEELSARPAPRRTLH